MKALRNMSGLILVDLSNKINWKPLLTHKACISWSYFCIQRTSKYFSFKSLQLYKTSWVRWMQTFRLLCKLVELNPLFFRTKEWDRVAVKVTLRFTYFLTHLGYYWLGLMKKKTQHHLLNHVFFIGGNDLVNKTESERRPREKKP